MCKEGIRLLRLVDSVPPSSLGCATAAAVAVVVSFVLLAAGSVEGEKWGRKGRRRFRRVSP